MPQKTPTEDSESSSRNGQEFIAVLEVNNLKSGEATMKMSFSWFMDLC